MNNNEVTGTLVIGDKNSSHVVNFPREEVGDTTKGIRSSTAKLMINFAFVGLMSSPIVNVINVTNTTIKIKIKTSSDDVRIARVNIDIDLDNEDQDAIVAKVLSQNIKLMATLLEAMQ